MHSIAKLNLGRSKEVSQLIQLFDQYRMFYKKSSDLQKAKAFIEARLERQESIIYIIFDRNDEKIVGFSQVYSSFSSVSMVPIWILNDFFIDDSCRGSGLGRKLIEEVLKHARNDGISAVVLQTAPDNKVASSLYESIGFKIDNEYLNYTLAL